MAGSAWDTHPARRSGCPHRLRARKGEPQRAKLVPGLGPARRGRTARRGASSLSVSAGIRERDLFSAVQNFAVLQKEPKQCTT